MALPWKPIHSIHLWFRRDAYLLAGPSAVAGGNESRSGSTQRVHWRRSRQCRLFTDREGAAPAEAADVCEVILSSLSVRRPRQFGSCWLGSRLWQELKLDEFFGTALQDRHGTVEWAKVIELLTVNRLCDPESELGVHQRWYGTTAMDVVLGTEDAVCGQGSPLPGLG